MTIDDPGVYVRDWTFTIPQFQPDTELIEHAGRENNTDIVPK